MGVKIWVAAGRLIRLNCIDIVTTISYHIVMNSQETIQIRIDAKTKEAARKTLNELGLDMSSAVKLFLTNVVNSQSIPLDLRTENGFTLLQEQALVAETESAKKSGRVYASVDSLMEDLER